MPIYEFDAWRKQYFDAVACPPDVHIPTDDIDAYRLNPRHRWVYYKLLVAQSQGLGCGRGHIIETHLRFADQWPDLYGAGWLDSMVRLYQHGEWQFDDRDRRDGYSIALFGPHNQPYSHPPAALLAKYRATPGILSLQITFAENVAASAHSMPPGGFRLAVINTRDFRAGERLRSRMARDFGLPYNQQREQIAG